jgi:hypothetical protein
LEALKTGPAPTKKIYTFSTIVAYVEWEQGR